MSLFEEFCAEGEKAIDRWIELALPEDEAIEFKTGLGLDNDGLSKVAKKQIAEELSGMANSAGGTLILGVKTKRENGLDVPISAEPIEEVDRFEKLLRYQLDSLVGPPIPGLRIHVAHTTSNPSQGFVAVEVPRSDRRPHMCRAPDRHTYFKRLGTSSVPMSPYEVEDQILRMKNAELSATLSVRNSGSLAGVQVFQAQIMLENLSDVSASNAWVEVEAASSCRLDNDQKNPLFQVGPRVPRGYSFYALPHLLIPPKGLAMVCQYEVYLAQNGDGHVEVRQPSSPRDMAHSRPAFHLHFGCLNTRAKNISCELSDENLDDLFDSGRLAPWKSE